MKFNPTPLECVLFIFVYLAIYIWTKHGHRIRCWIKDYFRQRRGPASLPIFTSAGLNQYFYGITTHFGFWDKPPRARKHHWFPGVRLPYAQLRKHRRGLKVSFLYSIIRLGSRQLIRSGLKALSLSGLVQTAFVERANLTLREPIAPLSRRTWSIAYDRQHLHLHIQ
jgi:hypothetical protein